MSFVVVIPARFASTRFPGKPLAVINGKTMLAHVFERAKESGANRIIVATDDHRISEEAQKFGAEVCMTSEDHQSGTSRISEVIEKCKIDAEQIIVNVQGDEPFIPPENIQQVADALLQHPQIPMSTLCYPITESSDLLNPNVVKVVTTKENLAIYFSRSVIPYPREYMQGNQLTCPLGDIPHTYYRHIGIYGYRAGFIDTYMKMPSANLEKIESLEQLKVLENGYDIMVQVSKKAPPHGVDTPEDLQKLNASFM
ncbi:3-deoxy-manno-octulosonate cytidylyltransferase [Glaciecola sp. 1036]|uniref:3-deoxy-manno-octulosonate cytidylyltransferase n=1 Tax=Alteromonadaceae TaxID=72275 RepID=UPI003D07F288